MGTKTLAVPICLPWHDADPGRTIKTGECATVAGWGITEYNRTFFRAQQEKFQGASTDTLQGVDLQLISAEDCTSLARETLFTDLPRSTFCTSSGRGAANGCKKQTHDFYDEEEEKGPFIKNIRKIFGLCDLLILCPHFGQIYCTTITQPPIQLSAFGPTPLPTLGADADVLYEWS